MPSSEFSQRSQVDHVPVFTALFIGALLRFEIAGDLSEHGIVQYMSKRFESDFTTTDVLVPINSAAERLLAVVQMQRLNGVLGQQVIDLLAKLGKPFLRADVVASGKGVARIETDTDAFFLVDPVKHLSQLGDGVAEARALTGRVFKQQPTCSLLDSTERLRNGVDDPIGALFFTALRESAGMHDEALEPQLIASFEFNDEGVDRFLKQIILGGSHVDQVGRVRDRVR